MQEPGNEVIGRTTRMCHIRIEFTLLGAAPKMRIQRKLSWEKVDWQARDALKLE